MKIERLFIGLLVTLILLALLNPWRVSAQTAQEYYYRAKQLDQEGKYDEAIMQIHQALELEPNFGKAHLMLGVCYSHKNRTRDAINEYLNAIKLDMDKGNLAVVHHDLGAEYQNLGMVKQAEAEFREALKLDPNFPEPKAALRKIIFFKVLRFIPVKNLPFLLFAVFFLFVMGMVFVTAFLVGKKTRKALKDLATNLNAQIPKISFYPTLKGEYQGLKYFIFLIPAGKNTPPYLKIRLLKSSAFKLSVYTESFFSNLGKKVGLIHEVKVSDEAFDKDFLLFSNRPGQASTYLNNEKIKEAIRGLFEGGFNSLWIDYKKITTQKPDYVLEYDLALEGVKRVLQKLGTLAQGL